MRRGDDLGICTVKTCAWSKDDKGRIVGEFVYKGERWALASFGRSERIARELIVNAFCTRIASLNPVPEGT